MVMENECRHNTSQMESAINYFCIILKRYDWRRIVNKHYFDFFYSKRDSSMTFYQSRLSYLLRVYSHFLGTRYRCNVYIYHVDRVCFAKKYGMSTRNSLQHNYRIGTITKVSTARENKNWWWKFFLTRKKTFSKVWKTRVMKWHIKLRKMISWEGILENLYVGQLPWSRIQ